MKAAPLSMMVATTAGAAAIATSLRITEASTAFIVPLSIIGPRLRRTSTAKAVVARDDENDPNKSSGGAAVAAAKPVADEKDNGRYEEIGPTLNRPYPLPLPHELREAIQNDAHPTSWDRSQLGSGLYVTSDWRKAWHTYESPTDDPNLIDPHNGYAEYEITNDMIEGDLPEDLVGVLYRNGPGKFGVDNDRVQHVLDADGLVFQIVFLQPPDQCAIDETDEATGGNSSADTTDGERKVTFKSRFVETKGFLEERESQKFLYRGTFGTAPRGLPSILGAGPRNGLNADPSPPSLLSKITGNALKTNIKNTANTQVVSFGGKVLALFEAGLPHRLDPDTLETLGEYDMGGVLPSGEKLPVKISANVPEEFIPDFLGGAAHTAHPNVCPRTGNLVGWHWSRLVLTNSLEVTFTEWSPEDFSLVATSTFEIPDCDLAPHDMALTENCVLLKVNALKMNQGPFLSGAKGPAASLQMDGRSPVRAHVFPRPTATEQFEPYAVEDIPPCFSIHFSHGYNDPITGNIVSMFSGWPPNNSTDFLGAWGGFAPDFRAIPPTYLFRMEIDPRTKHCIDLSVVKGCENACVEHPVVHPNFSTRKANYVYVSISNVVGDSTAPTGFARLRVEKDADDDDNREGLLGKKSLKVGEPNAEIDAHWFGPRCFTGEPLVVPKLGGDPENEREAYLLGMVYDGAKDRSYVAIFDLEREMKEGPVCRVWLKSAVPHGLHGCFAEDGGGASSVFC